MEALQLWVDWVKKGVASKDVVNWSQGDVPNQFLGGRAATMVMGPWQLANVKKSGIDFGIVTIPVPKEGEKPVVPLGGEVWCVLKGDSKVEEAAVKFVAFTQEPERLRKICDTFNYISSIQSVAKQQGEANPAVAALCRPNGRRSGQVAGRRSEVSRDLPGDPNSDSESAHGRSQRRSRIEGGGRQNQGYHGEKIGKKGKLPSALF